MKTAMSDIPTWHERAMAHPDHQSGMISEDMIRARMIEEISDLKAEVKRLHRAHQAACEGGDLLRAVLLAEVERLQQKLAIQAMALHALRSLEAKP